VPASRAHLLLSVLFVLIIGACSWLKGCGGGGGGGGTLATVTGYIADDSTLNGLSGAVVTIGGKDSDPSSVSGSFAVTTVPVGTRDLDVTLSGYQTFSGTVSLSAGSNYLGTLYLVPGTISGKGHISGIVRASGSAVAGARITAGGKTAYSKEDGTFAVYNLTPGNVTVQATSGAMSGLGVAAVTSGGTASVTLSIGIGPPPPPSV
jgi:hypothetical protein